ncbi:MAG: BrnT family toxin [Rhodocyclaceae bacterium]|jgi:hypothetical protein|nr:BrnT family toxin [Rhodocyclaceae bacterium]
MSIEYDPRKAESNLRKHKVSFDEAASCLLDPLALAIEDTNAEGEARWLLLGMSAAGRLLTVCYTLRGDDSIRLISARRATRKEEKDYAQGI